MRPQGDRRWSQRLGKVFAALAKKFHYPVLATVPVSAAMLTRVATVTLDQTLAEAAHLVARGTARVPVVDHGRALGVVTRDGLASALEEGGPSASIESATRPGVITVDPSTPAEEVLALLRCMPEAVALVVDHGTPVGVVTAQELADYLSAVEAA